MEFCDSIHYTGAGVYRAAINPWRGKSLMAKVNRSALMPYSAQQMFDIVNAVDQYPEFLPWCASSRIIEQSNTTMQASILMKKGKLNHSFTTRNTLIQGEKIVVDLVDGPFKQLS